MTLNLDRDKAAAIAAQALEQRPLLARTLGRSVGSETGWRVRVDLLAGDVALVSVRAPSGASIALWQGPRQHVEIDAEEPIQ